MNIDTRNFLTLFLMSCSLLFTCSRDWTVDPPLPDGLIAHYSFDGNADDKSSSGLDGIAVGASLTEDRFGNPNQAYFFDGKDDYIEVPHDSLLNPNDGDLSVALIFQTDISRLKNNSPTYGNVLLSKNQGDFSNGYWIGFNWQSNEIKTLVRDIENRTSEMGVSFIDSADFHQVVFVQNKAENTVKLYLDGEISRVETSKNISGISPDTPLIIGRYLQVAIGYWYFRGVIDDIKIYNKALSDPEVSDLFEREMPKDNDIMAYWPFNGNANDESKRKNHGTVHGAQLTEDRFGNSNSAYLFDGVDDFIEVPQSPSLNPINRLTITFWIRIDNITNFWSPIIHKGGLQESNLSNREYSIWLHETQYVRLWYDPEKLDSQLI